MRIGDPRWKNRQVKLEPTEKRMEVWGYFNSHSFEPCSWYVFLCKWGIYWKWHVCKIIKLIIQELIIQNKFIGNIHKSIWFVIWASECARYKEEQWETPWNWKCLGTHLHMIGVFSFKWEYANGVSLKSSNNVSHMVSTDGNHSWLLTLYTLKWNCEITDHLLVASWREAQTSRC